MADAVYYRTDETGTMRALRVGDLRGVLERLDPALPLETLVWRLFNEEQEVRTLGSVPLVRGCRCNAEHIEGVIAKFSVEERREMADADGLIRVDCAFCAVSFPIAAEPAAA